MKRTLTTTIMALLLCVCTVFGMTACGGITQTDIDNAVNEAIAPLNGQITALEADIADKAAKIATLESEVEKLEEEKASLTSDKATLQASIAAKETEITNLNSSITTLTAEKQTLAEKVAELEGRINCLEDNHAFEVSYEWATDYFACTATQDCTRTACDVKNEFTATAITVSGTTLTATFDGVANAAIDISTIENKDYFIVMGENGNSTYVIYNKAGLDAWRMAATADASTNLTLACDIEYNASWPKLDIVYNGRIEGNGYAIKGMDCLTYRTESYDSVTYTTFINELGSNGIIKHLGMAGCTFTNEYNSSNTGSSGFVCENYGIIMGCYNASTCISTADGDDDLGSAAGIAYRNYGLIIACYNVGTISSAAYDDASGISARNLGTISSCYNTGTVSVQDTSSDHYIPCAITSSNYKTIHDCYYTQPSMGYNNYAYPSSSTPTATNITNISGDGWTEAMNAMNAAIEAYNADETNTVKCDYRYAINTDEATGSVQPLVIVAVEAN